MSSGNPPALTDQALRLAADSGIYLGTSSWKYEGWQGLVYRDHYSSQKAFKRRCLAEYARSFPAVGVDATFYRFPDRQLIEELDSLTPPEFRFGLKVTEEITVYKYPLHPRYGIRKGEVNTNFLDNELFINNFLDVVSGLGAKLGPIIFQFGVLPRQTVANGTFLQRLDEFLSSLPRNRTVSLAQSGNMTAGLPEPYRYAVEIRNRQLFNDDYFSVLKDHGVAHIHSSWSWMPQFHEQLAAEGSFTTDYFVMRLLTPPQVAYQDAVDTFYPYQRLQKPLPDVRDALVNLLNRAIRTNLPGYVFINNRLEGAAPLTIQEVLNRVLESDETDT